MFRVTCTGSYVLRRQQLVASGTVFNGPRDQPVKLLGICYTWEAPSGPDQYPAVVTSAFQTQPYAGSNAFTVVLDMPSPGGDTLYFRLFAANRVDDIVYSDLMESSTFLCLPAGTRVTIRASDGALTTKAIEDVWYTDTLATWDHSGNCLAWSQPLWIMAPQAIPANTRVACHEITTAGGHTLNTIGAHRVHCASQGLYVPAQEVVLSPSPVVSTLDPQTLSLVSTAIEAVSSTAQAVWDVVAHNVLSGSGYLNLFADNVLTSCRYSNRPRTSGAAPASSSSSSSFSLFDHIAQGLGLGLTQRDDAANAADAADAADAAYVHRLIAYQARAVVFLDHQGVMCRAGKEFHKGAVEKLEELALMHGYALDVVVSSDWRHGMTVAAMQELYTSQGIVHCPVRGFTPELPHVSGTTVAEHRAQEVAQWLDVHGSSVSHFVVIDDLDLRAWFGSAAVHVTDLLAAVTLEDLTRALLASRPGRGGATALHDFAC